MKESIIIYLPYVLSIVTLYQLFLAGNKNKYSWLIALGNQFLWLTWILLSANLGLLPMNIGLWIIYYRNHVKWNPKEKVGGMVIAPIEKEPSRFKKCPCCSNIIYRTGFLCQDCSRKAIKKALNSSRGF